MESPSVSPGRPPPPSPNNIRGSFRRPASSSKRSFFLWFIQPCVPANTVKSYAITMQRARSGPNVAPFTISDARDETVRRAIPDEFVHGAALPLRSHIERAIFGKAARIAQIGDVLSRRPLVAGAPPRYRLRASLVEANSMARDGGGEVGPNDIEIVRYFHRVGLRMTLFRPARGEELRHPRTRVSPTLTSHGAAPCRRSLQPSTCSIFIASMTATVWPGRITSPWHDIDRADRALEGRPDWNRALPGLPWELPTAAQRIRYPSDRGSCSPGLTAARISAIRSSTNVVATS